MTFLGVVSFHILVPNDKPTNITQKIFNSTFMVNGGVSLFPGSV